MSSQSYEYDEDSQTWPYFLLTGILVPLIPSTISILSEQFKGDHGDKVKDTHSVDWCEPYNKEAIVKFQREKKNKKFFSWFSIFVIIGWISVLILILKIKSIELIVSEAHFDPWRILNIDENATEKIIKAAYRKLSIKFHPDKVDTKNMSQEEMDEVDATYVLINKAYKALTDETVKENFIKYGNPDGPAEVKHGIALPKFLIEGKASPLVVIIYVLLLAGGLPFLVSSWWSGVKSFTKQGLNVTTADYFLKCMINADPSKTIYLKTIIDWVSHSQEFKLFDKDLTSDKVYQLLMAHINREAVNKEDELLKVKIVSITPQLLISFIHIATAFKNLEVVSNIINAHRSILQAHNPEKDSINFQYAEILQLPGVDSSLIDSKEPIRTLGKFLKKPTIEPKEFLGLDKGTTDKIIEYAKNINLVDPIRCKFQVAGEDHIPPSSTAHIDLKFILRSANQKPQINEDKTALEEPKSIEYLRDPFKWVQKQPTIENLNELPFFPDVEYAKSHSGWAVFLVNQKDNKISSNAYMLNKGTFNEVSTFKMPFESPVPAEGKISFRLVLKNLSYWGADLDLPLDLQVEDKQIEEIENDQDEYGIESGEEDEEDEEEDEEEEDWTDIDTDTDEEEED